MPLGPRGESEERDSSLLFIRRQALPCFLWTSLPSLFLSFFISFTRGSRSRGKLFFPRGKLSSYVRRRTSLLVFFVSFRLHPISHHDAFYFFISSRIKIIEGRSFTHGLAFNSTLLIWNWKSIGDENLREDKTSNSPSYYR